VKWEGRKGERREEKCEGWGKTDGMELGIPVATVCWLGSEECLDEIDEREDDSLVGLYCIFGYTYTVACMNEI